MLVNYHWIRVLFQAVIIGTVALNLMGAGCVAFMGAAAIGTGIAAQERDSKISQLIGLTEAEVRERIGPPVAMHTETEPDQKFLVYGFQEYDPGGTYYFMYRVIQTPYWTTDCYALRFDELAVFRSFEYAEIREDTLSYDDVCVAAFWDEDIARGLVRRELERRAAEGDQLAAVRLGREFDDLSYLRDLARQGDRSAATRLGSEFHDPSYLRELAGQGDINATFALFSQLSGERHTTAEAWTWLCAAANGGDGETQRVVGNWHRTVNWRSGIDRLGWIRDEVGIRPDNRVAYMWYTLAYANGSVRALSQQEHVKAEMLPEEIDQAEQMVRDWKPGDCPSAENRLEPPASLTSHERVQISQN